MKSSDIKIKAESESYKNDVAQLRKLNASLAELSVSLLTENRNEEDLLKSKAFQKIFSQGKKVLQNMVSLQAKCGRQDSHSEDDSALKEESVSKEESESSSNRKRTRKSDCKHQEQLEELAAGLEECKALFGLPKAQIKEEVQEAQHNTE